MSKTKEFIDSIINNDTSTTSSSFNALIRDKVRTVLDVKRVELTSNIYNPQIKESTIVELFDTSYSFKKPSNFNTNEVFYSFNADGVEIKVQLMSEYADPVLETGNLIKVAFGRPLTSAKSWIKVDTEELLNVKNPMKVLSTVINGVLVDFITRYFKEDDSKELTINFHGALTSDEDDKNIEISDSKRSRIYLAILKKMSILKKYNLKVYSLGEDGIEISNA